MPLPLNGDIQSLRAQGFEGFLTIRDLRACNLECVPGKPGDIGVYVVLRSEHGQPQFLQTSTGGRFKGRDPNVAIDALRAKWVPESRLIYLGKAGAPGKPATLRSRLRQYLDFGAGQPVGHWGGRYIWHLPNPDDLIVAWKRTPGATPRDVERQMIKDFVAAFGAKPFANING